jgi:hypothetical protein
MVRAVAGTWGSIMRVKQIMLVGKYRKASLS